MKIKATSAYKDPVRAKAFLEEWNYKVQLLNNSFTITRRLHQLILERTKRVLQEIEMKERLQLLFTNCCLLYKPS